jgi:ribosomal protein S18 acetylase RimI-like enzyme
VNVLITTYAAAHFAGVDALWREVFADDPPWNRAEVAIPAKLAVQPELFLVALDGERVVGSVMGGYDGHRGWIYALAVKPSHRRRGIASALMHAIEQRLAALGCGKLNLQVRASNTAVIAFYEALGFAVEPRVSMGKRLPGVAPRDGRA